ncbi:hypothetical protein SAMN05444422_110140 [Halobiforma haloterrestris]|uniref:Uncharacterized protein n=1 Tax=Natronobacterium haloterrestre TaxID=148448 RepID=A0A1I1KEN1_NATHA|nr:hypothetical protein SAMN05444422_110140 [Halobiforma haloterrestris]
MPDGESERTIAKCLDCGAAYAAKEWPDGTIQPIGIRNGCQCGSSEFEIVEKASSTDPRED